jgi:hypothetical protein
MLIINKMMMKRRKKRRSGPLTADKLPGSSVLREKEWNLLLGRSPLGSSLLSS